MLDILKFIFSDFWIFCGTVALLYVIGVYCITEPIIVLACIFSRGSDNKKMVINSQFKRERITKRDKDVLKELSKEQLIYLIEQLDHSLCLIDEACVSESKENVEPKEAIKRIRDYIYDMPSLYDVTKLKAFIDMKMGKMTVEE